MVVWLGGESGFQSSDDVVCRLVVPFLTVCLGTLASAEPRCLPCRLFFLLSLLAPSKVKAEMSLSPVELD